ncbi:PEP-CTERM sorting domain-containing protein [Silvimonas amylolytica]|uniref:Ice-binding protein C-terminal domain-containing protein n=1 Tax=Silvimonas amylolytica TaxID=449663 RepID=A0ABQ2PL40_9NEIS|nr:PEP-CTERM sorting domain-containing protein [Silvimonas amylolytica]GGP26111.1 hypothetical protein GCM10010971_19300 [Silvimonas amylolytica]
MNSRSLSSLALACMLASLAPPGFAEVMDFDDIPISPTMISSPSHTDFAAAVSPQNNFTVAGQFTDLSFGSYNGTPVAPAWSGTIALNVNPDESNGSYPPGIAISSNNGDFFALANVRVYAPYGSQGAILNLNAFDLQGDNAPGPPTSFWYANVVIPAALPGNSPWVFVQLPTPENDADLFYMSSNTTLFLDHLQLEPVPEPGTWALLGIGLLGLTGWRRRHAAPHHSRSAMS